MSLATPACFRSRGEMLRGECVFSYWTCTSKCGLWTSNTSITWELAPPRPDESASAFYRDPR